MVNKMCLGAALAICAFFLVIYSSQNATAAMIELSTKDLAENSADIISGEVTDIQSHWNEDETYIFTSVTVRVEESFKGVIDAESVIIIEVPGGEVGEIGLAVEHAPRFQINEEVIIFLKPFEKATYRVTGWEQGKYTVENGVVEEKGLTKDDFIDEIKKALK